MLWLKESIEKGKNLRDSWSLNGIQIFIKDKLRCAKTIAHQHIGVLYERFVQKPLQHVVLQSLAGRLTGYHLNQQAVVFTHTQHHNRRIPNHFWHRSFY